MDTLVGYVSFVFDSETIKLKITQQNRDNTHTYENEEKVKLTNSGGIDTFPAMRSIADQKLIDELLYKKIQVEVQQRDSFEILGKIRVLGTD